MTPPISIDGTDITGATIDGTDVQEITVDGQTVFTAGPDIDGFETGNINNYTVNTAGFSASTNNVFEGTFCAEASTSSIVTDNPPGGTLPSFGVDFEFYVRSTNAGQPGLCYESSGALSQFGAYDGYVIRLSATNDEFQVFGAIPGDLNGNFTSLDIVSGGIVADRWYNIQVTFSGSTATYNLIDTTTNNIVGTVTHGSGFGQGTKMGLYSEDGLAAIDSIRTL